MKADLSLGEVQALGAKAARGAGRAHGTAQDAGFAVRWLCERGYDGAELLLDLLQQTDGAPSADLVPGQGGSGPFCPLILGAYFADLNQMPDMTPVHCPPLALPFLAQVAPSDDALRMICEDGLLGLSRADGAQLSRPMVHRAAVSLGVLAGLEAFAQRTYAPATEESRERGAGAGAGLTDSD